MARNLLTKILGRTLVAIAFFSVLTPPVAFSWNQATHAYIADQIGATAGYDNNYEMWGSVAPDLFNFEFDPAVCPGWIADELQGTNGDSALKIWNAATSDREQALAYGFVSHNGAWGDDHTAHVQCLTCGEDDGYILVKAKLLLSTPVDPATPARTFADEFATLGANADQQLMIAHVITEYAVDIRVRNDLDPLIGRKLATSSRSDTKRFAELLVKTYAADYAAYCFGGNVSTAASVLTSIEKQHRNNMIFLGQALSQPEPVAVQLSAEQIAGIVPGFLGHPLPVSEAEAVGILKTGMDKSVEQCRGDYRKELEATVEFVRDNLNAHGVSYAPRTGSSIIKSSPRLP
ncbi:MAG TPA: hypothetical protein VJ550_12000 [Geomonas sp.]|nr:hypothetical protein [Geomonas sp.]